MIRIAFRELSKEYAELEPVVKSYRRLSIAVLANIDEAKLLLKDADAEMREMGQEEMRSGETQRDEALELELQTLLLAQRPE